MNTLSSIREPIAEPFVVTAGERLIRNTCHLQVVQTGLDRHITDVDRWWPKPATTTDQLKPLAGVEVRLKRIMDFCIASVAVTLLFPLLLLIAAAVKLDSKGPALFWQYRSGQSNTKIKVYKFRTMKADAPAEFRQATKGDSRITRIGSFLRRTSLDELPQLINVIQGTMSLVGPRPHPLALDEKFKQIIPVLSSRYNAKPGITGWAQINGYRGETRQTKDMVGRVEHDRYYIRNWSLSLDFRIILLTLIKGWVHDNAY